MQNCHILLVEDENIIAMDIQQRLENLGYRVVGHVASGADALVAAAEKKPDLILMDIKIRGQMDGIETASQIRAKWDIPIIYLTAFADENTLKRARMTEAFGYLLKPFEDRELHSAIEIAIYKHRMEKKLRASENKFRSVIEHASDGIALIDNQGSVIEWNPAIELISGLKRPDVINRLIWEVILQMLPHEKRTREFDETNTALWRAELENGFLNKGQMAEYEIETPQGIGGSFKATGLRLRPPRACWGVSLCAISPSTSRSRSSADAYLPNLKEKTPNSNGSHIRSLTTSKRRSLPSVGFWVIWKRMSRPATASGSGKISNESMMQLTRCNACSVNYWNFRASVE